MTKPKTLNAFALGTIEYRSTEDERITIEIDVLRKAPKGSGYSTGKGRMTIRLTLSSWQAVRFTRAARQGMEVLAENAEQTGRVFREHMRQIGSAA